MATESKTPFLLLVEDSEDDAFFFRRTLQKSEVGCSLQHVTDGAQAVEFLQNASSSDDQHFPRVIFLDLKMPVLNGLEANPNVSRPNGRNRSQRFRTPA